MDYRQLGTEDYFAEIESSERSPERSLLAAMLERTIADLFLDQKQLVKRAREWIDSPEAVEWSYRWVCAELDLEFLILREKIYERVALGQHALEGYSKRPRIFGRYARTIRA